MDVSYIIFITTTMRNTMSTTTDALIVALQKHEQEISRLVDESQT